VGDGQKNIQEKKVKTQVKFSVVTDWKKTLGERRPGRGGVTGGITDAMNSTGQRVQNFGGGPDRKVRGTSKTMGRAIDNVGKGQKIFGVGGTRNARIGNQKGPGVYGGGKGVWKKSKKGQSV